MLVNLGSRRHSQGFIAGCHKDAVVLSRRYYKACPWDSDLAERSLRVQDSRGTQQKEAVLNGCSGFRGPLKAFGVTCMWRLALQEGAQGCEGNVEGFGGLLQRESMAPETPNPSARDVPERESPTWEQ
jgi:hypothetical protein